MTTITDKLAAALRDAQTEISAVEHHPSTSAAMKRAAEVAGIKIRETLAEYDAERATERDPDTDAFLDAAAAAHDADYYQIVDVVPIDRVDDGAWVTIRAFVSNEDAGVSAPEDDEDD